jgi:hypothetical protein
MRMDSRFEVSKREKISEKLPEKIQDVRQRLWKAMMEDVELTWLKDAPSATASRIIEMTLQKMRENRAREESWRMAFTDWVGTPPVSHPI